MPFQSVTVSGGSPGGVTLSASGRKVKGIGYADLTWTGATAANVDIYRNGGKITTTVNNGFYTDRIGKVAGGATYNYEVCEADTKTCSNEATVKF